MGTHTLRKLTGYLGVITLAVFLSSCSSSPPPTGGGGGGGGGGGAGGALTMVLTWTTGGDMDVGATTPGGIISANFPGNDVLCTHSGDDQGTGGGPYAEAMGCSPAAAGGYEIVVENYSSSSIDYTLTIQVNGVDRSGYPVTVTLSANSNLGNGQENRHSFTL